MKKCYLLFLLFCSITTFAQFKLSGKINHYSSSADLKINIPVVYGVQEQNSITIPVAKNGTFYINLPIKAKKFANLMFQANFHLLLLSPNKTLMVELDALDKNIKIIKGTALSENSLLAKINMEEYPFFLQNDKYTQLSYTAMSDQIVKPYFAIRDKKIALVNQSTINPKDKKLIAAELKYVTYNLLYELTDLGAVNQNTINKLIADLFNKANIKPDVLPAGPQYYKFVNNYLHHIANQAGISAKKQNVKPNTPISRWESAAKYFPDAVTEQFGYQLITNAFYNKDLNQTEALAKAFKKKFPLSTYNADINKKMKALK